MKKLIKNLLNVSSNKKDLAGLYRFCEIEYKKEADAAFLALREKFDV